MKGPQFNQADVDADAKKPRLKKGIYLFRVTSAGVKDEGSDTFTGKVNDKGNYVIPTRVAPVDGNGDTRSPGANLSLVGPFKTAPEDLEEAGLPADAQKKGVPNTMFIIERYAAARQSKKAPFGIPAIQSIKKLGGKWVVVDASGVPTGEQIESKEERAEKQKMRYAACREFFISAYNKADLLVGDEFYGEVSYDESGKYDGAQIEVCDVQDPSLLSFVDMTQPIEEAA